MGVPCRSPCSTIIDHSTARLMEQLSIRGILLSYNHHDQIHNLTVEIEGQEQESLNSLLFLRQEGIGNFL